MLGTISQPAKLNSRLSKHYSKTCLKSHSQKDLKLVFKINYHLIQVKSIAEHSAILPTCIKLRASLRSVFLSSFEWPLKTDFTLKKDVTCHEK